MRNREALERGCAAAGWPLRHLARAEDAWLPAHSGFGVLWIVSGFAAPEALPPRLVLLYGPHQFVLPEGPLAVQGRPAKPKPAALANAAPVPRGRGPRHKRAARVAAELQKAADLTATAEAARWARARFAVPSPWVAALYAECGGVRPEVVSLPFGVDTDLFAPDPVVKPEEKTGVFVYHKGRSAAELQHALSLLPAEWAKQARVFAYGSYEREDYRRFLRRARFGVWVGAHESQGFALQEALACDVPLLVWGVSTMYEEVSHGRQAYAHLRASGLPLTATTAAFWDPACGELETQKDRLPAALARLLARLAPCPANLPQLVPRAFVLRELADAPCLARLARALDAPAAACAPASGAAPAKPPCC